MKTILYNYDNLKKEEITETVIRGKALIINKQNKIMLGYCNNIYQFPGGHLEEGESLVNCIKREVLEETGIKLDNEKIVTFFKILHFSKDYPSKGKNRSSELYYCYLTTDKKPDLSKINLTENEKEGNFEVEQISLEDVEDLLINNIPNNSKNKVIAIEMIEAIKEYLIIKSQEI